jgi:hypothetical protein
MISKYSNWFLSVFWRQVALHGMSQDTTPRIHIFGFGSYFHTGHTWNLIHYGMSSNLHSQRLFQGRRQIWKFNSRDPSWNLWSKCKHHWYFRGRHPWHFRGSKRIGFTTSFANVDTEQLNTQIRFDADSSFFVCDNSTTGHICNDIRKFVPGSIRQTNKSLTTENGTGSCLQEGTVKIWLIDDVGTQHIFILDNCLYHPESPVNLLSTRRLAEKFLNADGNPDDETRIESRYSMYVLTWPFRQFKKTFPTPVSGLPELLFDESFHAYMSFCMQAHSSYANAVTDSTCWGK